MLNYRLNRYLLKIKERRHQFILLQMFGGILEYYDLFSLGFLFLYLLQIYNGHKLLVHGLAMITLTSYLFRPVGYKLCIWLTHHFTRQQIIHIISIAGIISLSSIALIDINENHVYLTFFFILLTRVLHGIAFGVKTQANLIYIKNNFPDKKHFSIMGVILGGQLGLSAAILMNKYVINNFSISQMIWAWKIPFIVSGGLGIILYALRLILYAPDAKRIDYLKSVPINTLALKNNPAVFPSLLIASVRGTITFSLFLILPGTLYWRLGWHSSKIADTMLVPTLINTLITWLFKQNKIKQQLKSKYLLNSLLVSIPLSLLLKYVLTDNNEIALTFTISGIAIVNGFLFIAIPRYLEQVFPKEIKLESMIFIHNYEYFGFNLLRGLFLLIAAAIFNLPLSLPIYIDLLVYSILVFILLAIIGLYILDKRIIGNEKH